MTFYENCQEEREIIVSRSKIEIFQEALVSWDLLNPSIGDYISLEWFCKALGLVYPDATNSTEQYKQAQFKLMAVFQGLDTGFRGYLLKYRKRVLKTIYGSGTYEVLDPEKQTIFAQKERQKDIVKALKDENIILRNVDSAFLSEKQRQENADAICRNVALSDMIGRRRPGF